MDSVEFPSELILKGFPSSACSGDVVNSSQAAAWELALASLC